MPGSINSDACDEFLSILHLYAPDGALNIVTRRSIDHCQKTEYNISACCCGSSSVVQQAWTSCFHSLLLLLLGSIDRLRSRSSQSFGGGYKTGADIRKREPEKSVNKREKRADICVSVTRLVIQVNSEKKERKTRMKKKKKKIKSLSATSIAARGASASSPSWSF